MPDAAQHPAQPELPSPYQPGKRRGRTRRTHTVAKVLLATLLTLGMVSGLSVAFLYRHLNGNLNVVDVAEPADDRPEKVHIDAPKQPINILVMGSDSRDCDGCKIDGEAGGGSDTTILFHLSADRQSAYGVSIPRDSLVDRPDCKTKNGDTIGGASDVMWNAAYSLGGPACTIQQFEQTTGIQIDNYIVVDFGSFQRWSMPSTASRCACPRTSTPPSTASPSPTGTRTLNGKEALAYVRVRHGVGDGSDIGRIKRQQAFIGALVNKVLSSGTLTRFDRLVRFLNAATKWLDHRHPQHQGHGAGRAAVQAHRPQADPVHHRPVRLQHAQPGRVEWTSDADPLWNRIKYDKPLGKLRDGSIGANQVPSSGTSSSSPAAGHREPAASSPSGPPVRHAPRRRRPTTGSPLGHLVAERRPPAAWTRRRTTWRFAGLCT